MQVSFSSLNSVGITDKNLMKTVFYYSRMLAWIQRSEKSERSDWVPEWLSLIQEQFCMFQSSVGCVLFFMLMRSEGELQMGQIQMRETKDLFVCCGLLLIGAKKLLKPPPPHVQENTHTHKHIKKQQIVLYWILK